MSDLPLLSPGDRIPKSAARHNEFVKAARSAHQIDMRTSPSANQSFGAQDVIRVYNDTGAAITARYAIVGLVEPIFLPDVNANAEHTFRDMPTFKIEYPCTDTYRGRFAVLQSPLDDDSIGFAAILSGKFVALVDDAVSAGDQVDVSEASRADDNSLSVVASGCALCLWSGAGTDLPAGTKWGLMRFGGGGGGGASVVAFTIDTADCEALTATGTVTNVACGLTSPAVGDSVDLVDILGCMLTGDPVGLAGLAVKMENPYGYDCEWVIQTLCCNAEMC